MFDGCYYAVTTLLLRCGRVKVECLKQNQISKAYISPTILFGGISIRTILVLNTIPSSLTGTSKWVKLIGEPALAL